jgi:hypothetical protein
MKRLFAIVNYESRANSNGWRTKYFWPEIVETDIEAELAERAEGVSPGKKDAKEMVGYAKDLTSFAWKTTVIERYNCPKKGLEPEDWLRAKAREYRVFNLKAIEELCDTGDIMNTLPPEHQRAYQFNE